MFYGTFRCDRLQKRPRARDRDKKDAEAQRKWLELCRLVEIRDGYVCRCCQGNVVKTIRVQGDRMEHHHVWPKSLGGPDKDWNVAILCKNCHDDRHVTRELHITGRADQTLTFEKGGKTWHG